METDSTKVPLGEAPHEQRPIKTRKHECSKDDGKENAKKRRCKTKHHVEEKIEVVEVVEETPSAT